MPEIPSVPDDAAGLRAANARLRGLLEERDARIAEQDAEIAGLREAVGAGNPVISCDLRIFMDQAAEPVAAENPDGCAWSRLMQAPGRRILLQ